MASYRLTDDCTVNLFKQLGRGAVGVVYHGKYKGEKVAVKRLRYKEKTSSDTETPDRFKYSYLKSQKQVKIRKLGLKEVSTLKTLTKHRNVVQYYGYKDDGNSIWLFIEYCNLGSLANYMTKYKPDMRSKLMIMSQCTEAVIFIHSFDPPVVHHDIKPSNILVKEQNGMRIIKLTDFSGSGILGTKGFMAPELHKIRKHGANKLYDIKSDIYSLGLVFYVLLLFSEEHPHVVPVIQHMKENSFGEEMLAAVKNNVPQPRLFHNIPTTDAIGKLQYAITAMTRYSPRERRRLPFILSVIQSVERNLYVNDVSGESRQENTSDATDREFSSFYESAPNNYYSEFGNDAISKWIPELQNTTMGKIKKILIFIFHYLLNLFIETAHKIFDVGKQNKHIGSETQSETLSSKTSHCNGLETSSNQREEENHFVNDPGMFGWHDDSELKKLLNGRKTKRRHARKKQLAVDASFYIPTLSKPFKNTLELLCNIRENMCEELGLRDKLMMPDNLYCYLNERYINSVHSFTDIHALSILEGYDIVAYITKDWISQLKYIKLFMMQIQNSLGEKLEFPNIIWITIFCKLFKSYRNLRMIGKANAYLKCALQFVKMSAPSQWTALYYDVYGQYHDMLAQMSASFRARNQKIAIQYFKLALHDYRNSTIASQKNHQYQIVIYEINIAFCLLDFPTIETLGLINFNKLKCNEIDYALDAVVKNLNVFRVETALENILPLQQTLTGHLLCNTDAYLALLTLMFEIRTLQSLMLSDNYNLAVIYCNSIMDNEHKKRDKLLKVTACNLLQQNAMAIFNMIWRFVQSTHVLNIGRQNRVYWSDGSDNANTSGDELTSEGAEISDFSSVSTSGDTSVTSEIM